MAAGASGPSPLEGRLAVLKRRVEYAMGMIGKQATLARLRKSRRLPLTEAAYNGHHEVLQVANCFVDVLPGVCVS